MIKLRSRPPVPKTLKSKKVVELKEKLSEKVCTGVKPKSKEFKPFWLENDVRKILPKRSQICKNFEIVISKNYMAGRRIQIISISTNS